jgi:hypothetical protein
MALKQRQKDIVNPYAQNAEMYNTSERRGVGYDYTSVRNRFIIDALQDSFVNFGLFPNIGETLEAVGPLSNLGGDERVLSLVDARAYCALYPQNAKVVASKFKLLSDDEIFNELKRIARKLASEDVSKSYETATTSEAQFIENQTDMPSNSGRDTIEYEDAATKADAVLKQSVARLISIPSVHSSKYTNFLRQSLGMPEESYEVNDNLYIFTNPGIVPYSSQNSNLDLYDWRNNVDPGTEKTKVYYNPIDANYYYVIRTNSTQPLDYVNTVARQEYEINAFTLTNLKSLLRDGVSEILKFTQRFSDQNVATFISSPVTSEQLVAASLNGNTSRFDNGVSLSTFMDERPSSPWLGCIRIPRMMVDQIEGGYSVSYEEFELTPFEKSQVISNIERASRIQYRLPIQVGSLVGKLAATRKVLRSYMRNIISEGISRTLLKNVNLEKEIDNLHNFINYLQTFYGYNKLSLEDEDIIEFYFSDTFTLEQVCVNGSLATRGIGNFDFVNQEDEGEQITLDAFGLMSPTSFSFLFYSPYIFKEYLEKPDASGRSWVSFLGTYMYPPLDLSAISTQIEAKKKKDADALNQKRQQNVFQKVSEIANTPSQSFEEMYLKRPLRYRLENIESNIQCSTAQARYAKYSLGIAKAFTTKTKLKSVTRQVILVLKNEIISDAIKRAKISIDGQEVDLQDAENLGFRYADNPELIRRDIEKYVNQQIFCSLDSIGDFIEDSFLDPIGAPPAANDLVRATLDPPIKFEFKERPSFSLVDGRRKSYEKIVNGIVENFLNALLAGIIRDLVNAFLGCGPNPNKDNVEDLKNSLAQTVYGGVEIREFLSDIDIVGKATDAGLYQPTADGNVDVTFTQMASFLDDVSKIVTASEATALLRGDAPAYLYEVILEMASRIESIPIATDRNTQTEIDTSDYRTINFDTDSLNVYFELLGAGNPTTDAYSSLSPIEAFCLNKEAGNTDLGIDFLPEEQLIVQLDESMKSKMLKISFFCDFLRNALDFQAQLDELMDLIPSMGWYDDLLGEIAEFSNSIFDAIGELLSGQAANQSPYPLGAASNFYTTQLGTQTFWNVNALFVEEVTIAQVQPPEENEAGGMWLQIGALPRDTFSRASQIPSYSWEEKFGIPDGSRDDWLKLKLPAYDNFRDGRIIVDNTSGEKFSQTYGTPVQIAASRRNGRYWTEENRKKPMPRLALVFRGANENEEQREDRVIKNAGTGFSIVDLSSVPPLYFPTNYEGPLVASDPLGGRDSSEDLFGTFETQVPMMNYSILNTSFMDNLSYSDPGTTLITPGDGAAKNTRSQFAMNINAWAEPGQGAGGPEQTPNYPQQGYPKLDRNLLMFGNAYRLNEKSIESFYTAPSLAPRRLPPFVRAVNKFPFELVDDKCVTAQEEEVASSIVLSIQARIARLMFNSGPLLQVYPQWCSDGTLYLLSDYLLRKFEKDYSQKQLIGVIYDNFDIIEKAYSDPSRNLNRDFRFYSERTPRENLRVLIRCVLYRVLDNIAEGTEYPSANKSIFAGEGREKFINLVRSYCERMEEYYTTEDPQPDKVREFEGLRNIGGFGGNSTFWRAGAYLFPLAQLYAAYIISWDMTGLSTAIKELDFQLNSQAAQADDAILTAVNGSLSSRFSSLYNNFPLTVTDYENTPRTYYNRSQVEDRVAYLRRGIAALNREEAPDFSIGEYEDLYFAAKRGGYYSLSPVDAPQEYYDTVDALLREAATGANQDGLGYQTAFEEPGLLTIQNRLLVASNDRFGNLRDEYRNRNITIPLSEICAYDRDQLDNFFQEILGYSAADTVSALWDDENDQGYTGRGEEPTTSQAVSVGILKGNIYNTMQKVCAILSAPTLGDAARAVGFVNEGDIQAEEDRIAINIARIQGEINILSRYI